jgi:uncharacterized protein (UPF0335 family)
MNMGDVITRLAELDSKNTDISKPVSEELGNMMPATSGSSMSPLSNVNGDTQDTAVDEAFGIDHPYYDSIFRTGNYGGRTYRDIAKAVAGDDPRKLISVIKKLRQEAKEMVQKYKSYKVAMFHDQAIKGFDSVLKQMIAASNQHNSQDPHDQDDPAPMEGIDMKKENTYETLSLESLRYLSGVRKTIEECGLTKEKTNEDISITATSGQEISGMLKDIMSLAGVHQVGPEHMPIEPAGQMEPEEPVAVAAIEKEPGGEHNDGNMMPPMRDMIDVSTDEPEMDEDSMNRSFDNSPHERIKQDPVKQLGDINNSFGELPVRAVNPVHEVIDTTESILFTDYKKFTETSKEKKIKEATDKVFSKILLELDTQIADKEDYMARRKALQDILRSPGLDKGTKIRVMQRLHSLDNEAKVIGLVTSETHSSDEVQTNELSKGTLGNYADAAFKDYNRHGTAARVARNSGDYGTAKAHQGIELKRKAGYGKAHEKFFSKADVREGKPSAGLSKKEKSSVVKKAKSGKDIGKGNFDKVASKAAKKYGSKEKGKAVAAAAMWKNLKREEGA